MHVLEPDMPCPQGNKSKVANVTHHVAHFAYLHVIDEQSDLVSFTFHGQFDPGRDSFLNLPCSNSRPGNDQLLGSVAKCPLHELERQFIRLIRFRAGAQQECVLAGAFYAKNQACRRIVKDAFGFQ